MAEGKIRQSDVSVDDVYGLVTESLDRYKKKVEDSNQDLQKQADLLIKISNAADTASKKGIDELTDSYIKFEKISKQANANDKERIKIAQTEERLKAKLASTIKGERDEVIKLQEETKRATKAKREDIKATLDQGDAYATLKRDTNKAQLEFKKLAAQYGVNSKQATEARRKFELLDNELREINNSAKDGRRDVGRYGAAIDQARNKILGWTAAIGGAAASLVGLFKMANSQDQLNKRLANSFDLTGDALDRTAKKVEFLSRAYDTESEELIQAAKAVENELNVSGEQAFDLIEKGLAKGANVRGEFLEQLKEYSTQFDNVGLSAEGAIAVITQQENEGVFSDKGVDAIKEAGIRLTEMPKATEEALNAIGLSGKEIQEQITSGQKTVFEVQQEISRELAKIPPNAKEVGTVLADVFGGAGEDAKGFVLGLGDLTTSLDDLEDNLTDAEIAQQALIEKFVNAKQSLSNALIPALTFLANNFETIVSIGGQLIAFFGIYKARIIILNALNGKFGVSLKKISKAFKDGVTNGQKFKNAAKALGGALKNIGWAIAISGAVKLAQAFWDVASGARQARQDAQLLDAVVDKFNERINEQLDARKKELDQKLELAKTEEERKRLKEEFIKQNEKEAAGIQKMLDKNKAALKIAKEMQKQQSGLGEMQAEAADQFFDFFGGDLRDINDIVGEYEAKVAAAEGGLKTLAVSTQDAKHSLEVFNKEQQDNLDNLRESTEEVESQTRAYKDLGDQIDSILDEGQFKSQIEDEEIAQEFKSIEDDLTEVLTIINDFEAERALTSEEAADNRLQVELDALKEKKKILVAYGRDVTDIELQISAKRLQIAQNQFAKEQELRDKNQKALEDELAKQKKAREELFNEIEKLGESEIENFIERSKRKQSVLDDEINQSKALEDQLRNAANNQNALASESLAAQEQVTSEKIRAKQEEADKEAALEELKAAWSALNSFLDQGENFTSSAAKALSGIGAFKQLVSAIPFFAKGTKDAPEGLAVTDEQGPEIHLDKYGNVKDFGSDEGPRLKYLHKGDKILSASESKAKQTEMLNRQLSGAAIMQSISMNQKSSADNSLLLEIRQLNQTIKDKPEYTLHPIIKQGVLVGLTETRKQGNKIENFKTLKRS